MSSIAPPVLPPPILPPPIYENAASLLIPKSIVKDRVSQIQKGGVSTRHRDVAAVMMSIPKEVSVTEKMRMAIDITSGAVGGFDAVVRILDSVGRSVKGFFAQSHFVYKVCEFMRPLLQHAKLAVISLAPLYLVEFGQTIYQYVKREIDLGDLLIRTFTSIGNFIDTIVTFLQDLIVIGAVPLEILKFLWPFDLIGIVLGVISIISHTKGWCETANFAEKLETILAPYKDEGQLSYEQIEPLLGFLTKVPPKIVGKALNTDGEELIRKVEVVGRNALKYRAFSTDSTAKKALGEWNDAVKTLRGRISAKIVSHKMGITTSSVNIFANYLLFISPFILPFCPVLAPVIPGLYALKGASGTLALADSMYQLVTDYQFNHTHLMQVNLPPQTASA